jgi:hypothetical protein
LPDAFGLDTADKHRLLDQRFAHDTNCQVVSNRSDFIFSIIKESTMLQQFKSMNELVQYLGALEERVRFLEEENQRLLAAPAPAPVPGVASHVDERSIAKMVASFLPFTNIVHPSFLKRAFAVWVTFL